MVVEPMHWCPIKLMDGVNRDTVWTWNAIGKRVGAWNLDPAAPEFRKAFLLNHLISELLPPDGGYEYANADPVTGQAAWYDLRVRIDRVAPNEAQAAVPRFHDSITRFRLVVRPEYCAIRRVPRARDNCRERNTLAPETGLAKTLSAPLRDRTSGGARMHPALSIIFFTTSSGAGFALLILLGLGVPLGLLPPTRKLR